MQPSIEKTAFSAASNFFCKSWKGGAGLEKKRNFFCNTALLEKKINQWRDLIKKNSDNINTQVLFCQKERKNEERSLLFLFEM